MQATYHRKLLKADIKVHLHRLTLSGCGTRLSDGRTNSAASPSESVTGLPKRGPVSIHGRGPKKSGCKLSGHLDDKRASPNLRNHGDASHRMNFIPLPMKRILHKSADNTDVGTHRRQHDLVCVSLACYLCIRLRYRKSADNLEH